MKNKNITFSKVLLFLVGSIAVTALAVEAAQVLYQSSGVTKFKLLQDSAGTRTAVKTSQDYETFRNYTEAGGDQLFLVSSSKTVTQYLDAEGISGSVSWSVRSGPRLENVLWSRTESSATELNLHGVQPVLGSGTVL